MILDPYRSMRLLGEWNLHVVQVALPEEHLRLMLPPALDLAPQDMTPPGTHPLRFYFTADIHAWMSWPPGIDMLYQEHCLGVPFLKRLGQSYPQAPAGPCYYTPRIWLDQWMPTYGGLVFWGYEKRLANIDVTQEDTPDGWTTYAVADRMTGIPQITARWKYGREELDSVYEVVNFDAQRFAMDQPIYSELPMSVGPFQFYSNLQMTWGSARVKGIEAEIEIHQPFVPGLPVGRFTSPGGITDHPFGAYLLSCPWELSLPYSADLSDWLTLAGGAQGQAAYTG